MKIDPRRATFDRYLRQLRAGGRTNMYGAVPYLMKAFGLDRNTAFNVVCEWLDRQAELSLAERVTPTPHRKVSSRN